MHIYQIMYIKQEGCSDDEIDSLEKPPVKSPEEFPSASDILHLEQGEAKRLTGALINDYSCEIVNVTPILSSLHPKF